MKITRKRPSIRIRGRSFMALVLSPVAPISEWLAELDVQTQRAASFFQGRFVILDLSLLPRDTTDVALLIEDFSARGVRLIAVEGADPAWDIGLPPPVVFSDQPPAAEPAEHPAAAQPPVPAALSPPVPSALPPPAPGAPESPAPAALLPAAPVQTGKNLLLDRSVRSGQTVVFEQGDVIVVGSVSSGAEIFAGGSIHIYGTLRGRAIAGMTGGGGARIFCQKLDAELLAIEGVYKTADDMEPELRGRAVQAWLDGDEMILAALG